MTIDWSLTYAAVWRSRNQRLRPVKRIDPITLDDLIGIEHQKQKIVVNTERFLKNQPVNNVLLWGARGTGKSSLIKALLNEYQPVGLRVIEVDKDDLIYLAEIVDELRDLPQKFVIFCDDLSFEAGETHYKHLKSVLEGSIELPPENILLYATSNRRHLMPEHMKDNLGVKLINDEIHYTDTVEEKISLADRFGLWLSFYPINIEQYLKIVDHYFAGFEGNYDELHEAAKQFADLRASKSGRTAKQFFNEFMFKEQP